MNNEDFEFNQRQFKATGMLEHFNSGVIEKMGQAEPRIRHEINPSIDGEQVKGAVYLNKAKDGDRYFLNKFDMEKTRPNGTTVKQTFYNNNRPKAGDENSSQRPPQQWTQKRAFNFLSGRPVYDKNNNEWNKINLNKKLKNGNYASDRFDKNYGFDLQKTMSGYSYADAGDKQRMDQLAEGFERGNLQKVKLVGNDGKKEDYYQSVSIRTGSMKVYDKDKKEVPLEQQVEKGLITKDLSEKLKEIYGKKQEQKPENKPEVPLGENNSQKNENKHQQAQKPGATLTGKEDKPPAKHKTSQKH